VSRRRADETCFQGIPPGLGTKVGAVPNPYESTVERLERQALELHDGLREFLVERSRLTKKPAPPPRTILVAPPYKFEPLDDDGRALQAQLRRRHSQFSDVVKALLPALSPASREADAAFDTVSNAIEQVGGSYRPTTEAEFDDVEAALESRLQLVRDLYDPSDGIPVYVPDANAVVWNDDLEAWTFAGVDRFSLVLTSTLLSELDALKMRDRNERVREAAERAIRRIKEFMRRGEIHGGVPLSGGNSVRMTAAEPNFETTLPWLDALSEDDRLLASTLEIVREYPRSPVLLVTRDVNMQNKATLAGLPYVEPPDPEERPPKSPKRRNVQVIALKPTGGGSDYVDFVAEVQNYETVPIRVTASAKVGGEAVAVHPEQLDLLANALPTAVRIIVPRPRRGELVDAFAGETTLYGATLRFAVAIDDVEVAHLEWTEIVYSSDNSARQVIQERIWRIGRGEETEDDLRAEAIQQMLNRRG
jgi:hypothetical protein